MPEGVRFGQYELLHRIARGGMAEIFLAMERGIEGVSRKVVVKRILPQMAESEDFVTMFMDEARLATRLAHPNIAHIYNFGEVDGVYFLAMEYVEGLTASKLARTARVEPIPPQLVLRIMSDVCAGLHFAHELTDEGGEHLGVVHRDVSPQNVMVSRNGVAKLLDFGVARASSQVHSTGVGQLKGKLGYMAPEAFKGRGVDRRADVFAAGVVLFELLGCRRLFARESEAATMHAIIQEPIPSLADPALPPEVDEIIARAVAKNPADRYGTALELQGAIEELMASRSMVVTPFLLGKFITERVQLIAETKAGGRGGAGLPDVTPSGNVAPTSSPSQPSTVSAGGITGQTWPPSFVGAPPSVPSAPGVEPSSPSGSWPAETPTSFSVVIPPPRRTGLVIFLVLLGVLAGGGGMAALFGLRGGDEPDAAGAGGGGEVVAALDPTPTPASDGAPPRVDDGLASPRGVDGSAAHDPAGARDGGADSGRGSVASSDLDAATAPTPPPREGITKRPRATGTLFLDTSPWSRVRVGGRSLGTTPIIGAEVPAGAHAVRLVDSGGRTHRKRIRVRPGQATKVYYDLTRGP